MPPACLALSVFCVIAVLLLVFSLDAVEQNQYGLRFNWFTKSLSKEVYHGGTHLIGFWNKFLVFPATVQTIEFSSRPGLAQAANLHTRTKEGLALHLSISFQYRLDPEQLQDLFAVTNMDYENLYIRIARDKLLEAASQYEGPQYWRERQKIGDHMRDLVGDQLKRNYASLWGLQLQVIDLPDRYEDSITKTQVQQQMIKTRENEQVAASIRADTDVLVATYQKDIQVVQADAQANYTEMTKIAKAEAAKRRINAEADAVGYVRKKLNLTTQDLVRYQQLQSYAMLSNATFMADVPGGGALLNVGPMAAPASETPRESTDQTLAAAVGADDNLESFNSDSPGHPQFKGSDDTQRRPSFLEKQWRQSDGQQ